MAYTAIALAVLGMAAGFRVRFPALLVLLVLLFLISVAFSVLHHFGLSYALLIILAAQAIVQAGYFIGLVARHLLTANRRNTSNESGRSD